jgi:putative ABC transport system permease protein
LGIGSTTAVFSLVDALLLHPLPAVPDPGSLVAVVGLQTRAPDKFHQLSWADYQDFAAEKTAIADLAAMSECELNLTGHGPAERVSGLAVSPGYFTALRLRPALGRFLSAADDKAFVAVIGYDLWQRLFNADPGVIGSAVDLNGKSVTVIGVAPRRFVGTSLGVRREIWLPLGIYPRVAAGVLSSFSGSQDRKQEWLGALGRLPAGVRLEQAQSALDLVAVRSAAAYAESRGRGVRVVPLTDLALGQGSRPLLKGFSVRLLAITCLVLAVAVVNIAGLLLARMQARQREIAVRLSLGVSRGRLVRQFLAEGSALALLGLVGGIGLAKAMLPLLERLDLPIALAVHDYTLSYRTLSFALAVSLASCLIFSLLPALRTMRTSCIPGPSGSVMRGRGSRMALRDLLAAIQVALTLLILIAAGLMLRTVANLGLIDPGFDPSRVLVASVDLAPAGYEGPRAAQFYRDLLDRLRGLPGVEAASMASALPVMGGEFEVDLGVTPEDGQPAPAGADASFQPSVRHALVEKRFFQTVKMKVLRGRTFADEADTSGTGVVIVNETAARLLWGNRDALGRRLRLAETEAPFQVIGVVADATFSGLKEQAVPVLYLNHAQYDQSFLGQLLAPQMTLFVRTARNPRGSLASVREAVRSMDPRLPVFKVSTLEELLNATVGVERQAVALYSALAFTAMALAMFGLWGVLTQTVLERRREIGIRMACGATTGAVRALILRRSLLIALCGVAAGLAIAVPARRIVASQLYGIEAADPVTWLLTLFVVVAMALTVSLIPAHRASRMDPVAILRQD